MSLLQFSDAQRDMGWNPLFIQLPISASLQIPGRIKGQNHIAPWDVEICPQPPGSIESRPQPEKRQARDTSSLSPFVFVLVFVVLPSSICRSLACSFPIVDATASTAFLGAAGISPGGNLVCSSTVPNSCARVVSVLSYLKHVHI